MPKTSFQLRLLNWYQQHKRELPWRKTKDPYRIWLSEIILQQTRVNQGMPYYLRFADRFPTIKTLAEANDNEVMKLWEGLGYYSRARHMLAAARTVVQDHDGVFPATYSAIKKLKGVGDYTAAAIASFAFDEPQAVVDGNVYRVLARYCGIDTPINTGAGQKQFAMLASRMLDREDPSSYNQAIMEFGALQCRPKNPNCMECVLQADCQAFRENKVDQLPGKKRKVYNRVRYFHFLRIQHNGQVVVERREAKDVWNQLFQFPLIEGERSLEVADLIAQIPFKNSFTVEGYQALPAHKLSHQTLHCHILELNLEPGSEVVLEKPQQWIALEQLEQLAFPRPLRQYLDGNQLTLPLDS